MILSLILAAPLLFGPNEKLCGDVLSVTDGDTFVMDFSNLPLIFGKHVPIRIRGIDTPELKSKEPCLRAKALTAKKALVAMLDKKVCLTHVGRDKYWRLVASLPTSTGGDVSTEMLRLGLALPYDEPNLTKKQHSCF